MSIFRNNKSLPKYLTDRKWKMSAVFYFRNKRRQKGKFFKLLKGRFFVMGGPMDMIFGVLSETYDVRLLKSIT